MFSWCSTYEPVERNFVHMCTLYIQLNDNKIATYLSRQFGRCLKSTELDTHPYSNE